MASYSRIPGPPLSAFVDMFWLYEGYQQPHKLERLLPDGSIELVVNLKEDVTRVYDPRDTAKVTTLTGSSIAGPHSEFFVIDTAEQHTVAGIHFKPGGAFPFLCLPSTELHNRLVSLDDLWGPLARQFRERLLEAPTAEAKFDVMGRVLIARAAGRFARHPAVAFALREFRAAPRDRTIGAVTGQIGLSARRFIQVFSAEVGLNPKLFCRVRRFQRALRHADRGRRVDWAGLAADCGYFDQAHFIHDFRAFSGISPSAYAAQRTEHLNHVPLAG
jgi:AraC-like DNA-binding protein